MSVPVPFRTPPVVRLVPPFACHGSGRSDLFHAPGEILRHRLLSPGTEGDSENHAEIPHEIIPQPLISAGAVVQMFRLALIRGKVAVQHPKGIFSRKK